MGIKRYLGGVIRNLRNPGVKFGAIIDSSSKVNPLAKINRFAKIVNSQIGKYSYVGGNSWIINTSVGNFCSIASDVNIGLASHTLNYLSTSPLFTEKFNGTGHSWIDQDLFNPSAHTEIGSDVWIGFRTVIKAGVKIGHGAVIGAGAVVTKDVPPYAIVGGIPAKLIRYRFPEEIINKLLESHWWDLNDNSIKKNISIFQREEISVDLIENLFIRRN